MSFGLPFFVDVSNSTLERFIISRRQVQKGIILRKYSARKLTQNRPCLVKKKVLTCVRPVDIKRTTGTYGNVSAHIEWETGCP